MDFALRCSSVSLRFALSTIIRRMKHLLRMLANEASFFSSTLIASFFSPVDYKPLGIRSDIPRDRSQRPISRSIFIPLDERIKSCLDLRHMLDINHLE